MDKDSNINTVTQNVNWDLDLRKPAETNVMSLIDSLKLFNKILQLYLY